MKSSTVNYTLIIPHHNNVGKLNRLLQSVPAREDLQVLVVDDCSDTDLEGLEELKNQYPDVEWCSTERNGGAGAARNAGLAFAKGKWVLFADDDDYFTQELEKAMEKYVCSGFEMVCFDARIEREDKSALSTAFEAYNVNPRKKGGMRYRLPVPWGKFIKRELIEKNNILFEESRISNDKRFSTLCDYKAKDVCYDTSKVYVHQVRKGSVSGAKEGSLLLKRFEINLQDLKFLRNNNVRSWYLYKNRFIYYRELLEFQGGKYRKEARELVKRYGFAGIAAVMNVYYKLCGLPAGRLIWKLRQLPKSLKKG